MSPYILGKDKHPSSSTFASSLVLIILGLTRTTSSDFLSLLPDWLKTMRLTLTPTWGADKPTPSSLHNEMILVRGMKKEGKKIDRSRSEKTIMVWCSFQSIELLPKRKKMKFCQHYYSYQHYPQTCSRIYISERKWWGKRRQKFLSFQPKPATAIPTRI